MSNTLEQAKSKIHSKYPHLKLLEYNGYFQEAEFIDSKFGKFSGIYQNVFSGSKKHPKRVEFENNNRLFSNASDLLSFKNPHLILKSYVGRSKVAEVQDIEYGLFTGVFNNILLRKKKHPDRLKNERFNNASEKIKLKFPHLTLLKYSTQQQNATVYDAEYGEFTGLYYKILSGQIKHISRKKDGEQSSFDSFANDIKAKYSYLTLLKKNKNNALFLDDEYGEFEGNYHKVLLGSKRHPKRSLNNKVQASKRDEVKEKRKKTCIEKYGKKTPLLTLNSVYNFNGETAFDIYTRSDIKFSYVKFLRLIKSIGLENALKANTSQSSIEFVIECILRDLNVEFKFNKGFSDTGYRPDYQIPDSKLIIEADGLYFHSDLNKEKRYHRDKKDSYNKCGYRSLFFRSDEILTKTDIVNSVIKYHLGKLDSVIYARKCSVGKGSSKDFREWFYRNHLMGSGSGDVYYLTYQDDIVAALSIIKRESVFEISRFCNKLNITVIGGFSKLLSKVISDFKPSKIISFVDYRYGTGKSLLKSGFIETSDYLSFKWTNFLSTFHRMKYPGNTGYDHNLVKIWDCGQKKFELILNH